MKTTKTKSFASVSLTKLSLVAVGVFLAATTSAVATVFYVNVNNARPTPPYTTWATAARDIQDAVDEASAGDEILVTNGVYAGGSWVDPNGNLNCVVVDTLLTLQSVNGPEVTVIDGGGKVRCLYLTDDAEMDGFTLTNGVGGGGFGGGVYGGTLYNCTLTGNSAGLPAAGDAATQGGGAYDCELYNCTLTGNSAYGGRPDFLGYGGGAASCTLNNCLLTDNEAEEYGGGAYYCDLYNCTLTSNGVGGDGGGACGGTLNNCTLTGNEAQDGGGACGGTLNNCFLTDNEGEEYGGGACGSTLNNCTLAGNIADSDDGGGAYDCELYNCIIYFNTSGGNYDSSTLNYCCTTPMPANGVGNITNAPLFVNYALQPNSPCINAGNNAYVVGSTDLNGNRRIVGGTVDIGAYEYQTPVSLISYAWLEEYGLSITTNTDTADLDGTGMNVYQDWIAGLNPTNALSVLKMLAPSATNNPLGLVVSWQSVGNVTYFLQSSTNLAAQPAFSTIQSNLVGQPGTTSYTDTNAVGRGPFFYRVGVGN